MGNLQMLSVELLRASKKLINMEKCPQPGSYPSSAQHRACGTGQPLGEPYFEAGCFSQGKLNPSGWGADSHPPLSPLPGASLPHL